MRYPAEPKIVYRTIANAKEANNAGCKYSDE